MVHAYIFMVYTWCVFIYGVYINMYIYIYIVSIGNRWYICIRCICMVHICYICRRYIDIWCIYIIYMVFIFTWFIQIYVHIFRWIIFISMYDIYIYIQFFLFFMYRIQNSIIDHQRWDYASNYTLFKQRICSGFGALKTSRKKLSIEGSTRKRIGRFTKNKFMAGHRILISDIFWYVLMMFFKFRLCSHYF